MSAPRPAGPGSEPGRAAGSAPTPAPAPAGPGPGATPRSAPELPRPVSAGEGGTRSTGPPAALPGRRGLGRLLVLGAVALGLIAAGLFLTPALRLALSTVSTDDAYVNAHVTHVAPRIAENVRQVLVENNDFVHKGDLLVVLDKDLPTVRLAQARAAVEVAERARDVALAKAQASASAARANRFKLMSAIAGIQNEVVGLRVAVARWKEAQAAETLARAESARYAELLQRGSVTKEQADVRQADYQQAQERLRQALGRIEQIRAELELPEETDPAKMADAPADLDQVHSSVRAALGQLALNLADFNVPQPRYDQTPNDYTAEIRKLAPGGDMDALIEEKVRTAPTVEAAQAQVLQAKTQLAEADLNLSYCEIRADIDGFVSNRSVNPGDRVSPGQRLLAVRSRDEVWIDCNFKETQLEPLRIGQPVDVSVDAYPGKLFRGRVSGFSPGTGASMALLPAQNATGNFVKIVQRLPVRVDLVDGNPPETPLFVGLSATPRVRIHETPTGPNAGQRLRGQFPAVPSQAREKSSE